MAVASCHGNRDGSELGPRGPGAGVVTERTAAEPTAEQSLREADESFVETGARAVRRLEESGRVTEAAMTGVIKMIGGSIIAAFMVIVVLSQVFSLDIISESSGPFANLTSDYVNYGTAALGLVGIGIIVAAAAVAINAFGGMGGR